MGNVAGDVLADQGRDVIATGQALAHLTGADGIGRKFKAPQAVRRQGRVGLDGAAGTGGHGQLTARQQLAATLAARIDRLPSSARQKVEDNLAQLRRAADEINAALALQPGDALLEELLLNTYQDELAVLASVNQLANLNGAAAPEDMKL